jgi:hypothetical protein
MSSARDSEAVPDPSEAASGQPRLLGLEAAPEVPAEAREELLALKSGAVFVCALRDGDIRASGAAGLGLYADDTRHLSEPRSGRRTPGAPAFSLLEQHGEVRVTMTT